MKVNVQGMEIECTVEEFEKLTKLFGVKEEEKNALEELNDLKHWTIIETELEYTGEMKVVLINKTPVKPEKHKTYIEAMGEFWRNKQSGAE